MTNLNLYGTGLTSEQQILVNQMVQARQKDKTMVIVLWLFFASLGAHRFYLGNTGYAICLILFGWMTLFIWPLVDLIFAMKELHRQNEKIERDAINEVRVMHGGVQGQR